MKKKNKYLLTSLTASVALGASVLVVANKMLDFALKPKPLTNKYSIDHQDKLLTIKTIPNIRQRSIMNDNLILNAYEYYQDSNKTIIVVHGHNNQSSDMATYIKHFYDLGYNVLAVDNRAHGRSQGNYITMGSHDSLDLMKWIDLLISENKDIEIGLFGISMGAATIMNVLGYKIPHNIKLAIEDCGYTTPYDILTFHLNKNYRIPPFPIMNVATTITKQKAKFNLKHGPIKQLRKASIPTLFIHGDEDNFVPFKMLDELYNASSSKYKKKLVIHGAGHARCMITNPKKYWENINQFLEEHM